MKQLLIGIAALSASLLMLFAGTAFAASVISNGSFETGTAPGTFLTLTAPNTTDIPNWSVDSGSVDYIGTYWTAADGTRSLDMSGNDAGSISQTFATTVGVPYIVTFNLSGNPDGGPALKDLQVNATGGSPQDFTFDTSVMGNTDTDMMWQPETYTFTASSSTTTLSFTSETAGFFGPALDNVAVTASTSLVTLVTTNPATNIISSDATLNGTNGPVAAGQESFWVSTSTFPTTSPTIPTGVFSTPVLPGVAAHAAFSDPLSIVATGGIPGNIPGGIMPNTTYYFVAWANINGTWYPGAELNFTTGVGAPPADACSNTSVAPAGFTLKNGTPGSGTYTLAPMTMFVAAAGSPKITGPAGNYIICLKAGSPTITLGDGSDTIVTGSGNPNITVGNGGSGSSTITTGSGNSTIKSTDSGNQTVTVGNGSSHITTGAGNDTIVAGAGNSTIDAGAGTDSCTVGPGHSTLTSCNP